MTQDCNFESSSSVSGLYSWVTSVKWNSLQLLTSHCLDLDDLVLLSSVEQGLRQNMNLLEPYCQKSTLAVNEEILFFKISTDVSFKTDTK